MASPFKVFRKHQRWLIATLGLLAMIAFVFLPIILQQMGPGGPENPVVVTTSAYGDLRASEVQSLIRRRQVMLRFLEESRRLMLRNCEETDQARGRVFNRTSAMQQRIGEISDKSVVDTWLFTRRAEQLGLLIGDEAITEFIRDFTMNLVNAHELQKMLKEMRVGELQLFEVIRGELMALRLQEMFAASLNGTTPAQRWDYYGRMRRWAKVELAAVPVADFVDRVKDPGDAALKEFFEEHKDTLASPAMPEAGFQEPHRIAVEYFKADLKELADTDAVTDEEIEKAYNENRKSYDQAYRRNRELYDLPSDDEKKQDEEKKGEEKKEGEKEAAPEKEDEPEPKEDAATEPKEDEAAEPKEDDAAEEKDAAEPKEGENQPPEEAKPPATDPPADEKPADKPAESDDTSSRRRASPFRLTALLQEPAEEKEGGGAEQPAATPEPADKEPDEKADEKAGEEGKQPAGPALPVPEMPSTAVPKEPIPEVVKSEIPEGIKKLVREDLARGRAIEKVESAFAALQSKMKDFHDRQTLHEAVKQAKPQPLDFLALAKEYGLAAVSTPLFAKLQAEDYDIGTSFVGSYTNPFYQHAFQDSWAKYIAETSVDVLGNRYLFWKVKDSKQRTPKFEDEGVRENVLLSWKMVQARSLAIEEANRLAEKARKAGAPLADSLGAQQGMEIVKPAPFTWLTGGNMLPGSPPTQLRLSQVEGVDFAGADFMRAVFGLEKGEVGVAKNQPQTIAYVVRAGEFEPPHAVLWRGFQVDPYQKYVAAAHSEQRQTFRDWAESIRKEAGLKWLPRAERPQEEEAQEEE